MTVVLTFHKKIQRVTSFSVFGIDSWRNQRRDYAYIDVIKPSWLFRTFLCLVLWAGIIADHHPGSVASQLLQMETSITHFRPFGQVTSQYLDVMRTRRPATLCIMLYGEQPRAKSTLWKTDSATLGIGSLWINIRATGIANCSECN